MRRIVFSLSLLAITTAAFSQKPVAASDKTTMAKQILASALKYNDVSTAIMATHEIIQQQGNSSPYKDSLAILYYTAQNYVGSISVAREVLAAKPNNAAMLEVEAFSYGNLGGVKEAISSMEKLFPANKNIYHGYKLATWQQAIGRSQEAIATANAALAMEAPKDLVIQLPAGKDQAQNVPIKAALYNVLGLLHYDMNKTDLAVSYFKEALKLYPDFVIVKQNMQTIDNLGKSDKK